MRHVFSAKRLLFAGLALGALTQGLAQTKTIQEFESLWLMIQFGTPDVRARFARAESDPVGAWSPQMSKGALGAEERSYDAPAFHAAYHNSLERFILALDLENLPSWQKLIGTASSVHSHHSATGLTAAVSGMERGHRDAAGYAETIWNATRLGQKKALEVLASLQRHYSEKKRTLYLSATPTFTRPNPTAPRPNRPICDRRSSSRQKAKRGANATLQGPRGRLTTPDTLAAALVPSCRRA